MEIAEIKELIAAFKDAGMTDLEIKDGDFKLKLGKEINQIVAPAAPVAAVAPTVVAAAPAAVAAPATTPVAPAAETAAKAPAGKTIKAPIVGTFYAASSPDAAPFVEVGTRVKKGDVVCVIEAMKLMNEVEAEEDGEIVEILVSNEEMVEFGQPLFTIR